ncbi:DNA-processing protein DprA [Kiritimatiellota bacterium B12222]|nr:DNA-processing protein DprA [Kiritimatiellota bacterium B12222]
MMTEREALIALNMVDGIGPVRVRELMQVLGSAASILEAEVSDWVQAKGIGQKLAEKLKTRLRDLDVEGEIRRAEKLGAHIVTCVDESYPEMLKSIHDPPLALYVKGELLAQDKHAIAMVGSRRCTHYGTQVADRLSFQLAKQGYTVVSGLARGIDAAAHEGALKGGGRTLAVLGTGIDQVYPPEHVGLAEKIMAQGALISEFPIGFKPTRQSFPQRNRIVAGATGGTLVVEAARGSGAMMTVDFATEFGRLVFAVPGRIDNPSAGGCNGLIKNGAKLVEDVDDILEEFEYLIPPKPEGREDPVHAKPQVQLTESEKKILDFLGRSDVGQDELIRETGLSASVVATALLMLEMKRQIKSLPGQKIRKVVSD